jgi:hypothetical protein
MHEVSPPIRSLALLGEYIESAVATRCRKVSCASPLNHYPDLRTPLIMQTLRAPRLHDRQNVYPHDVERHRLYDRYNESASRKRN